MLVRLAKMAKTVDELFVYRKAMEAAHAISAILDRPAFRGDRELSNQLDRASVRVVSNIAEGFEQRTDRHFARYLYDARAGVGEIKAQLEVALKRRHLTETETEELSQKYAEVGTMLTGLINRLNIDDRQNRPRSPPSGPE